ncbi:hypothetical protein R5R35_000303 [Gryllus longicercus]|uniref:Carboxylic ester hydrolase n=1 Tax=Gryllus longicercus TaxID=2509291 RepID=A0AAN9WPY1_9ORTH
MPPQIPISPDEFVTVRVEQGSLRGRTIISKTGLAYFSFKGVPYAKPPLGPLRFKDAVPPESWEGHRDALVEGSICTQLNLEVKDFIGSEDCLYLNVYTPILPMRGFELLPVMVWFHGGGFASGSGTPGLYGPDYLITENVILVTVNYRLGPFGFLYLGEAAPGNAGLKDQVQALRWLQKNIAAFGGDPTKVTIFGESAGGASVHMHMFSPMSKGLFHRAIAQSGAAVNPWAAQTEPAETTRRLARALGCASKDPHDIVHFLRGVDHLALVRAANKEAVPERDRGRLVKFAFVPTPEHPVEGVEMFLPASPMQLMKEGRHHAVPFMTGITSREGLLTLAFKDYRDQEVGAALDAAWEQNVLPELRLPADGPKNAQALEALRRFYMAGQPLSEATRDGYVDMFSDIQFGEGVDLAVKHLAKTPKAPVYLYYFMVDDQLNFLKLAWKLNEHGACHADENGYLFYTNRWDPDLPPNSTAVLARRRMLRLWANFARTGNPTPNDDSLLGAHWKPYTEHEHNYLEIGAELRPKMELNADRVAFWEEFYKKYSS